MRPYGELRATFAARARRARCRSSRSGALVAGLRRSDERARCSSETVSPSLAEREVKDEEVELQESRASARSDEGRQSVDEMDAPVFCEREVRCRVLEERVERGARLKPDRARRVVLDEREERRPVAQVGRVGEEEVPVSVQQARAGLLPGGVQLERRLEREGRGRTRARERKQVKASCRICAESRLRDKGVSTDAVGDYERGGRTVDRTSCCRPPPSRTQARSASPTTLSSSSPTSSSPAAASSTPQVQLGQTRSSRRTTGACRPACDLGRARA